MRVAAGLIISGDRLLVCQRRKDGAFPLKWEFPGGKVEPGEGDLRALRRELREELGIEVRAAREIFRHGHLYEDRTEVELIFFRVEDYEGTVSNKTFHQLRWVYAEGLEELDFLEGDRTLIEKLVSRRLSF